MDKYPDLFTRLLYYRVRVINRIIGLSRILALRMISFQHFAGTTKSNESIVFELEAGNFLSRDGIRESSKYLGLWQKADYLFGRGHFWEAQSLRKEVLVQMYSQQGIEDPHYYPPFISSAYTVAIGHLGALLLNNVAKKLGILSNGKQSVLVENRIANSVALDSLTDYVTPAKFFNPSSLLVLSTIIENFQVVKSMGGFIDRYELWEKVFLEQQAQGVRLDIFHNNRTNQNLEKAKSELFRHGLQPEAPIAVLHFRNNGNVDETRNVDARDYIEVAKKLHRMGFQVCQIGVNRRNSLQRYVTFVKSFEEDVPEEEGINFYLLFKASVFVGTTSGPATFPTLLGIPSLITNLTSVSRNALSSPSTIYLPQLVKQANGHVLGLEEQLRSRFSFGGEFLTSQLDRAGLQLQKNSSEAICDSLTELLDRTKFGEIKSSKTDQEVRRLQKKVGVAAFGFLSNSFIERHSLLG